MLHFEFLLASVALCAVSSYLRYVENSHKGTKIFPRE